VFFGDYTNIAAWNGKIYPIWMRLQGSLSVWNVIIEDSISIPVELNNFTANADDGKVYLSWETSSETNNYGFFIERKHIAVGTNSAEWIEVGFEEGNGTTTDRKNYSFVDQLLNDGTYHYRLKQTDFDGSFKYSNEVEVSLFSVKDFELSQNYPNPFNPSTTISFQLPIESFITLKVYDAIGTEVETIAEGYYPAGVHEVIFSADKLSSGLYLYRITSGKIELTKKMLVVK
jgi:hypothetical protein